jgi:FixJ family two-component response regulator
VIFIKFWAGQSTWAPAAYFSTLVMQQMTGLEFQQILRAYDIFLPVIFLSAHGTVPAASAAFKGDAVDFLMKPVHSEELIAAVSDAIAKHANTLIAEESARSVGGSIQPVNTARTRGMLSAHTRATKQTDRLFAWSAID